MEDEPVPAPALSATISIEGMPAVLADMRRQMAQLLLDAAEGETPAVATRLREIAALFETGLSE